MFYHSRGEGTLESKRKGIDIYDSQYNLAFFNSTQKGGDTL